MRNAIRKALRIVLLAAMLGGVPLGAAADEQNPQESGHPLRVAAYVLHPVGVVVETLLFRPAHWLVSHEPWKTLFGHTD
ncbi:MAG: hypothetical protein OEM05_06280 [Myxococcales bacterium]|nr:hypothetical protein [Myxococcales bacterium]